MGKLLSIRTSLMSYSDIDGEVSNPLQKGFDWARQYLNIPVGSATSDDAVVPPGGSVVLFDGSRALPTALLAGTSEVQLSLLDASKSTYRLQITTPPGAFRTERSLSLTAASQIVVSISNNALATFTLSSGGSFAAAVPGDILRIKGMQTGDVAGPFSPINSGYWVVLTASSSVITARRAPGKCFEGVAETVVIGATDTANQFRIYSSAGVQAGDSMLISGTLSSVTRGDYAVLQVGPDFVDFVSGTPLPLEGPLVVAGASDFVFYTDAKQLVYIEVDQKAVVRYNAQSDSENVIKPITVGSDRQPGLAMKWGHSYRCEVVNTNEAASMRVNWIVSE